MKSDIRLIESHCTKCNAYINDECFYKFNDCPQIKAIKRRWKQNKKGV